MLKRIESNGVRTTIVETAMPHVAAAIGEIAP
jgi:hypothetical protein